MILLATGSEVNLAIESAKLLRAGGVGVRVVSMPSQELFAAQDYEYQESVLPSSCPVIISIEAGTTYGWGQLANFSIGLDHFGASAPYKVLAEKFGFTPQGIVDQISEFFSEDDCGCGDDDCGCGHDHDHDHACACGCDHK